MSRLTSVSHTARYQVALTQSERREPTLTLIRGPGMGRVFPLMPGKRSYVLGRESTCDLYVDDHTVSRSHARFDVRQVEGLDTVVRVRDLGSTNGTWLNGERIQEAIVAPGDKIHVGEVILRFDLLDNIDRGFAFRASNSNEFDSEWGPSINDRRHALSALLFLYPSESLTVTVAGLFQSGQPINLIPDTGIFGTTDLNGDGASFSSAYLGNSDRAPGIGRNSARLPWSKLVDLGLRYEHAVPLGQLEVTADVFNVFDTTNLSGFANSATQSNQIQVAGQPFTQRNAGAPRQFQFGLSWRF